jgi:trans-2,3-dihydro-3-hydroxyanthranilate isomerase
MPHRFILADVFTGYAFGGNQLAVFPDAANVPEALMQPYARELNFSETTFVLPPRKPGHSHRVRIFTPTKEIPFAGHPNLGTAAVLASLGGGDTDFVFDEDVGTVKVSAKAIDNRWQAELTLENGAKIEPAEQDPKRLTAMLSLPAGKIGPRPAWWAGVGLPFFYMTLSDFDAVADARFDTSVWETVLPPGPHHTRDVYAVAGDFNPGGRLKARMWAPADGIPEDPATGSAAAALAGSLAAALPDTDGEFTWTIEQGAEIGRPSVLTATAVKHAGQVVRIRVGGGVVIVGRGEFG